MSQVRQRLTAIPMIHGFSGREESQRRKLRKTRKNTSCVTSSASCRCVSKRTHRPYTAAWNSSTRAWIASTSPFRHRRTSLASSVDTRRDPCRKLERNYLAHTRKVSRFVIRPLRFELSYRGSGQRTPYEARSTILGLRGKARSPLPETLLPGACHDHGGPR